MTLKFTVLSALLKTVISCNLTLIEYVVGVQRTIWNSMLTKPKLKSSPGKPTIWYKGIDFFIPLYPELIQWETWEYNLILNFIFIIMLIFIFSHCIKMIGLIRSVTFNYSTLVCMLILYFALIRSKVEYASVVWNSITSTDGNKLERIQQSTSFKTNHTTKPEIVFLTNSLKQSLP
jgi:hypothetical protein